MRSTKRRYVPLVLLSALLAVVATASVGSAGQTATCKIKGTNKADTLKGTSRADVICGLKGNDKIAAGKGKDRVDGGAGNDTITAVDGEVDQIDGGAGTDSALVDLIDVVKNVERIRYNAPILSQFNFSGANFTIGSKKFTEQLILGQIAKQALEYSKAQVKDQIGCCTTSVVRQALKSGEVDMYWEYTGTGWIVHLNKVTPIQNAREQWLAVKRDDVANGITWLSPAPLDNTYALAVRKEAAASLGNVKSLSDLGNLIRTRPKDVTVCVTSEFFSRDDGLPGVEKHYGYQVPRDNIAKLDPGLIYKATDEGKICNFGVVFATDGRIEGLGLAVLRDDKQFFPVYNAALNVRTSVFQRYPKLDKMFRLISLELTNELMQRLNADVDVRGKFPEEVARSFLSAYGFTAKRK